MPNNILVLTNNIGGLFSFRKEVIKAVSDVGYTVNISAPDVYNNARAEYFESIGCNIIKTFFDRRGTNPIADFGLMIKYWQIMRNIKPVAVLTYTIKPNVYGGLAARLSHVPQLANITGLGDSIENGGVMQKLTLFLYHLGVSKACTLFFQNSSNRDFFINNGICPENKYIILPGSGVNLDYNKYQRFPVDDGKVRFLFIGRLLKDKGIEEYFEMAKVIKAKYPTTEFQILGNVEGPFQEQLNNLTRTGIIKHLGSTSDVRPYIGAVECTIMPSYHEGMSNVNLESAANGRAVITTNVPGCRETVEDGLTGIIVNPKDIKALIDGVERFLSLTYEEKKQMGIEGRKKVEKEFDRQIVISAYLNEIKSISNV